jgi:hypothetical protein
LNMITRLELLDDSAGPVSPDQASVSQVEAVRVYLGELRAGRDEARAAWQATADELAAERRVHGMTRLEVEELREATERHKGNQQEVVALRWNVEAQTKLANQRATQLFEAQAAQRQAQRSLTIRDAESKRGKAKAQALQREADHLREAARAIRMEEIASRDAAEAASAALVVEREAHESTKAELDRVTERLALRSSQLAAIRAGRGYRFLSWMWRIRSRVRSALSPGTPQLRLGGGE